MYDVAWNIIEFDDNASQAVSATTSQDGNSGGI